MIAAGITRTDEDGPDRRYMVLGWDDVAGWRIMPGIPTFATKEEAVAEYWRIKATETEKLT